MTQQSATTNLAPVVREVEVAAPVETCFTTFVDDFAAWWPPEHHVGERTITELRIEPQVGGRCYDIDAAGGVNHWGTVLAIEPPTRLVFAWHIQADWSSDHDPARQSEVEVTFRSLDDARTAVRLEHRHLERHGAGAAGIRESISKPGGWGGTMARFGDVAEGRPPRPLPS